MTAAGGDSDNSKNFAEFFAGVGLFRLGLEAEGLRCVFANDNDPRKTAVYRANFGGGELIEDDINSLSASMIPDIGLATASFPCVDLSLAGTRRGLSGERSGAFHGFIKLLKGMGRRRPRLVLLENVPGLLSSGGGGDIRRVLETLGGLGYGLDIFILDARWFTPQSRPRLFVLGRRGRAAPGREFFEKRDGRLKPPPLVRVVESVPNARWGFVDIPSPPEKAPLKLSGIVEKNGNAAWWDKYQAEKLLDGMNEKNAALAREAMAGGKIVYAAAFRRVRAGRPMVEPRFDGLAGCLRTPRGGSSRQMLLALGRGEIMARNMTAREYGRLQGAPEGFRLPQSQNAGMFAFGDAVCVPAIRWIAGNVLVGGSAKDAFYAKGPISRV
ncbi:MAG: DNA cytosine methyltransferase [Candidatus Nitrospinota bacterium M3_3B_026]